MSWQLIRGPSGKVCFELDAVRALVRVRHNKDCTDIVDLTAYGLAYAAFFWGTAGPAAAQPDFAPANSTAPIDFSAKM